MLFFQLSINLDSIWATDGWSIFCAPMAHFFSPQLRTFWGRKLKKSIFCAQFAHILGLDFREVHFVVTTLVTNLLNVHLFVTNW